MRNLNILVEYDLRDRVIVVTLDNASTNNIATKIKRPLVSRYHEKLFHQRCNCHIVNLIVKDSLD